MLHDATGFPDGVTRYTAGWRSVAASLSDVAAMGGDAEAAVAIYGAPSFDAAEIRSFVRGASEVCESVDAAYVGGDLDETSELTVATTALGRTDDPVYRSGADPGDAVCVTGALGRTAGALRLFDGGEVERANDLFRFPPRVAAGVALRPHASAMMDVSDGLARSLHQIAEASDCGMAVDRDALPTHAAAAETTDDADERLEATAFVGEDFELLCTIPDDAVDDARDACPVSLTRIGRVTSAEDGIALDGDPLSDRGWSHGT
jgi:thiamine-monophosphate kinase